MYKRFLREDDVLHKIERNFETFCLNLGRNAGLDDDWIVASEDDLRQQLEDDLKRHSPSSAEDLISYWIEGWEETDHFRIRYVNKMYAELSGLLKRNGMEYDESMLFDGLNDFWEGFFRGLQRRKIDIYKIANEVMKFR